MSPRTDKHPLNSVPIVTILSLTTLNPYFSSTPLDYPWHAVAPTIWSQIMLNLSIITACVPSLKRFLADLQSGAMAVNITESFEMGVSKKVSSSNEHYASGSGIGIGSRIASKFGVRSQQRSNNISSMKRNDDIEDAKYGIGVDGHEHGFTRGHNDNAHNVSTNRSTVERSDSVKGLTDGVIYRSVDFKVEYEGRSSEGSESRNSPPHDATWHGTSGSRNEDGDRISDYDVKK